MGNLTGYLQGQSTTVEKIFESWKERCDKEQPRGYLGASIIGKECSRALWYGFRWCGREKFIGRMYRLFDHGDIEEIRMVKDLRDIGCEIHEFDSEGNQFGVTAINGHFSGHLDGCGLGIPEAPETWHVLEFKTHNAKSFRRLESGGVQASKPLHYAQMQIYMHLTGMRRAIYLACNKNTDDLYSERVHYDKKFCEALMSKAEQIIRSSNPPERLFHDIDKEPCKWCEHQSLCYGESFGPAVPCDVTCRSCAHAEPVMEGENGNWWCDRWDNGLLTIYVQKHACEDHVFIPGLVTFAEAVNIIKNKDGSTCVQYMNESDNKDWIQGPGKITSEWLKAHSQGEME